ncbi:MAG: sulfurtransferase [Deltaproteobacteria bacterium]|jgi:thiosulfate/3-mercaptopyruvate sulfurtransferase
MAPLLDIASLVSALHGRDTARLVLVDARRSRASYLASHLAGARWVDLDRELAAPAVDASRGGRHPLPAPEDFARVLGRLGIEGDAQRVVVYDDQGGALAAARLWWMLRAFQHADVQVLDGGWAAIEEAAARGELALERGLTPDAHGTHEVRAWRGEVSSLEEVDRARLDPRWLVLDVRAADRYRGENESIDPVAGHIPGVLNAPYAATNLDERGRFRDPETLRRTYQSLLAGRALERLVVHCGSGVTACHTLLSLEHAGLRGARLYVGSWSEWCRRPDLPRVR